MYGWCPYIKEGTLKDKECHFDGYCSECPYYKADKEENIQD